MTANPLLDIVLPRLDTGYFDFTPPPAKDPKLERLNSLPKEDFPNLLAWTLKKRPFLGPARPFRLDNHLYLRDIYLCQDKEIVLMKASQMGASEWLVSYAINSCDMREGNVFYVFPTSTHVSDFSTARLGPAIEASEYLEQIIIDGSGSGGMRGSDKIALKRIRNRFLYFRGSQVDPQGNAPQLKSVDADVLIFDEVDELDPRAPAIAKKRLGHAKEGMGNILWVSTPTLPGYGIHEQFLESNQKKWHIRCDSCGNRQDLTIEDVVFEWDDMGRPLAWHGQKENRAWIACRNCGAELNRLGDGEWVETNPGHERTGFHLSKLFSAQNQVINIVKGLDTVDETKRREAYNQDLGLPHTPRGGGLDSERLDACRRDYAHGPNYRKTCYMGVDVGSVLHVVIRTLEDFESGETRQIYAGEASWTSIHNLVKIYRPRVIVMDALPETSKAREFQQQYPRNMVWIAYYPNFQQGSKKEDFMSWNPVERQVLIDRTRALDATLAGFFGMKSTLPAHARNIRDYYNHMRASIRILKEDTSGTEIARYIDTGPDHYLHAENYCLVAGLCRYGQGWTEGSAS